MSRHIAGIALSWRSRSLAVTAAVLCAASVAVLSPALAEPSPKPGEWPVYGGNASGQRYSALTQINPRNVAKLIEAWRFETGPGGLQTSPLMIDRVLYVCAPDQSVVALDPASGKPLWRFASGVAGYQPVRGLSYWREGKEQRLFASSAHYLYALDPASGEPIAGFGQNGRIDLRQGLGRDPASLAVFLTTPGTVYRDLIITGFRTGEGTPAAPGDIRAYDVRTGALRWSFRTIPEGRDAGAETWPAGARQSSGAANNWTGMALDAARGIVYVPTGSPASDFYGADRPGSNLYANSLLALDAASGRLLWHFQAVHHDLWDRDFASPPSLLTVRHHGRRVDAVAQASKQGFVFLFDRVTGKPLFPIEERAVPPSEVPGERSAPTQPFPALPRPLARQTLTEDTLTRRTPEAHAAVLAAFRKYRSGGQFTPFEVGRKTVLMPGFDGGAEWGGAAVDPARGVLYINAMDVPWLGGLRKNAPVATASPGKTAYDQHCAACHGIERQGSPPDFPPLTGLAQRLPRAEVEAVIDKGKGRMPGFPQLTPQERGALLAYLLNPPVIEGAAPAGMPGGMIAEFRRMIGDRKEAYLFTGYEKFRDPDGYPAIEPPWGTLNAIDLNTGQYLWSVPLGEYPELVAAGQAPTGTENYGGPLLTASRLLFIGATIYDRKFRAFDARSGRILWQTVLPYAGVATPISYAIDGRQYVVIAASGSRDPKGPQGSAYVAYALPGN